MDIKDIESQKKTFINYTDQFIRENDDTKINGYIDKQNHSLFVLDEALLTDAIFTKYNDSFKNLLALESLFHDIGRFRQLKETGTFKDNELKDYYPSMEDHGDLGKVVIEESNILRELIPDVRMYDEEIKKVIGAHAKVNPELLYSILVDYIKAFRNYDLSELFKSNKLVETFSIGMSFIVLFNIIFFDIVPEIKEFFDFKYFILYISGTK